MYISTFMYCGVPAHFTCDVNQISNSHYPDRRTGRRNCRVLPVVPSEGHSLLKKGQHTEVALAFRPSDCAINTTNGWNLSARRVFLASQSPVISKLKDSTFSHFCRFLDAQVSIMFKLTDNFQPLL